MSRKIAFAELPLVARITTGLTMFLAWVLFAELIIDRHGLDQFLPFYRVGNLCPYDLLVLAGIALCWWRAHRR